MIHHRSRKPSQLQSHRNKKELRLGLLKTVKVADVKEVFTRTRTNHKLKEKVRVIFYGKSTLNLRRLSSKPRRMNIVSAIYFDSYNVIF
jgi:hypothetical protein